MRKIVFAFAAVAAAASFGATLDVNGTFAAPNEKGMPKNWCFHGWEGYLPNPKFAVVAGPKAEFPAIRFEEIPAQHGSNLRTTRNFPCTPNDVLRVSFLARGKGEAWAQALRFTKTRGWNDAIGSKPLQLTADWTAYEIDLALGRGKRGGDTAFFEIGLGGKKGTTAEFAAVSATLMPRRGKADEEWRLAYLEKFAGDDYEKDATRDGEPTIETCDVAPGLLAKTRVGHYRADGCLALAPAAKFQMPNATNECFAAGARVYSVGVGTAVAWKFTANGREFTMTLKRDAAFNDLVCEFTDGGKAAGRFFATPDSLPADFVLAADKSGDFALAVTSLSQSTYREFRNSSEFFRGLGEFEFAHALRADGKAEATLDNRFAARAEWKATSTAVPYKIDAAPTFDPVKAGWPLVFADEFDGTEFDWSKWYFPCYCPTNSDLVSLDGKGMLNIKTDFGKDGKLRTAHLYSKPSFGYGYFESRLRFTRNPGWWAAFWLYASSDVNPVLDGFEIDIFEDYYTRPKTAGGPYHKTLDHNVHVNMGRRLKSWNYNSELPGSLDDFYVLGCKWTPFEISYYLNGKLIKSEAAHSPYASVTFDAFHHCVGTAKLQAIVSGQIMSHHQLTDAERALFPEIYAVDWVRVYAYPATGERAPKVTWKDGATAAQTFAAPGERLRFAADVAPAADGAPIETVYLFDNGYLIDFKTKPPYEFTVPFNAAFYDTTRWTTAGRSGARMPFDGYPHAFTVRAQDAKGRVGTTDAPAFRILKTAASAPHGGKAQKIPGKIALFDFDDGGENVAWWDTTKGNIWGGKQPREEEGPDGGGGALSVIDAGEWINYTVDVDAAEAYHAAIKWGSSSPMQEHKIHLLVDGVPSGTFKMPHFESTHGNVRGVASIDRLALPAGRHVLTLLMVGRFGFGDLTFTKLP